MKEMQLTLDRVKEINSQLKNVTICAIGDLCLDLYLYADMKRSELSRETPHYPLPVVKEIVTPGGGGNVVNNMKALNVGKLLPVSVIGNDWRGFLLLKYFEDHGFDTTHIIKSDHFITNCYCKPMRMGISQVVYEDPRLDFENREPLGRADEERVLEELDKAAEQADVIAVSDQMKCGVVTEKVRERLSFWAAKKPVIADSRYNATKYENVIVKPNEVEAAFAIGRDINGLTLTLEDYADIGAQLHRKNTCPAIVTLGELGALWCDEDGVTLAPTVKAEPPVDIVGAGDTFLAAVSSALAAGARGAEALAYGNLASGVTVKKIGTTGTASQEEILEKYKECYQ